jgi:hypothetical protein
MATSLGGLPCVDPTNHYRQCIERRLPVNWWGQANAFSFGLGREPGRGKLLMRYKELSALDMTTDHDLTFTGTDPVANVYTLQNLTVNAAECLSPGASGDDDAVFLVDVADRRNNLAKIPIDKGYNVSSEDGTAYLTNTKNGGSNWTWQTMVNDLVTALGLSTGSFTLPFTPHGTPENLTYWGSYAWDALCNVLDRIACAVKYDPAADTFSIVRLGSTDATAAGVMSDLDGIRTWDGYPLDPSRAWRPEKIRVRFNRRPRPTDGSSPYYNVDVTLAATTGVVSGTYVILEDDLTALGATGTPTNSATLSTRATERSDDWLRKRQSFGRRLLKVYRDFNPDVPGSVLGSTVGQVGFDDRGGPFRTEIVSRPDDRLEDWRAIKELPRWFPQPVATGTTPTVSAWKDPVRMATTVAGTLATSFANGSSIDGVTLVTGDRILIKNQATQTENGIYTVNSSGAPTRATDADTGAELLCAVTMVSEGTVNRDTVWGQTTNAVISVGASNIVWAELVPSGITVEDIDSSPTYPSSLALRFDQADGFSLSQPSAGVARVDLLAAGTAQIGTVTTSAQSFAGDKTFIASVIAGGDLSSFADNTGITQIEGGSVGHASIDSTWPFGNYIVLYMKDTTHITSSGSGQESITVQMLHVNTGAHGMLAGEYFVLQGSNSRNAYMMAQGYSVRDSTGGSYAQGFTGSKTVSDGTTTHSVTVNGGIITGWT